MRKKGWYKKRPYAHFDLPMGEETAKAYVSNCRNVESRSFLPFIGFDITVRRYKVKGGVAEIKNKSRPIRISSHIDGYIFSYYSHILLQSYEKLIQRKIDDGDVSIGDCALAYRKGKGTNITFSKDAFDEIKRRKLCIAIAIDIEKFFDSINHENLKLAWCKVLGVSKLPEDHYAVFKAITRYAWVDREKMLYALGIPEKSRRPKELPQPLCNPSEFRKLIRGAGLININRENYGIPQGSAMSAMLSNIYMIGLTKICKNWQKS